MVRSCLVLCLALGCARAEAPPRLPPRPLPSPAPPVVEVVAPEPPPPPPFREPLPDDEIPESASRVSGLSPAACRRELVARALPIEPSKRFAGGVATPMVITGPMHGVRFVAPRPPAPYGILDCRLALALEELAALLASHGVAALRIDSMYRPNAKLSRRRKLSQHAYGLAIDILAIELRDGRVLSVERDWHAPLPSVACGPDAVMTEPNEEAIALRNIACAVARSGIFHHLITPSEDAAHRTHFHFDIKRPEAGRLSRGRRKR